MKERQATVDVHLLVRACIIIQSTSTYIQVVADDRAKLSEVGLFAL
jgi:hypothetical protein